MKALTTTAGSFRIWIIEDELTFYLIIYVVHLHAYYKYERLGVDDDPDVLLLHNLIKLADLLRVFAVVHNVRVSVAAPPSDTNFNSINLFFLFS